MSLESVIQNLRSRKDGRILLHVILWLFYFFAIYYLGNISFNSFTGPVAFYEPLKATATTILIYYPMIYFGWHKLMARKRYVAGILFIMSLVIIYALADHLLERLILESCQACMDKLKLNEHGYYDLYQRGAINVVVVQLVTLGIVYQLFVYQAFPLALKIFIEYFDQRINTLRLQKENIQLEFNFLKAQVNPHFLFNTLNNIYALILKDDKIASSETVAKLAAFMRYTLYESGSNSNNIVKEIDLLKTYIDLERIRLNDTVVNFITNIDNEHYMLPPLLFIPVVENAFKYNSPTRDGDAYIFMKLEVVDSQLVFVISNTFDKESQEPKIRGGIGLQNLKRRLEFHYPGPLSAVKITEDQAVFQVTIQLNLS